MGIVAFYAGYMKEGIEGCKIAIENGVINNINVERDRKNLEIYEKKESEVIHKETTLRIITKNEFINIKKMELRKEHPNLTEKQLIQKAKLLWKDK